MDNINFINNKISNPKIQLFDPKANWQKDFEAFDSKYVKENKVAISYAKGVGRGFAQLTHCYSHLTKSNGYGDLKDEKEEKLRYKTKNEGKNKGQYGYYISNTLGSLYLLMNAFGCKSILDLGSGSGHLMQALGSVDYSFKTFGYEIEDELIKENRLWYGHPWNKLNYCITKQDIMKLTKKKLCAPTIHSYNITEWKKKLKLKTPPKDRDYLVRTKPFDAIYMWEPFCDQKLGIKFANHLVNKMHVGQYIFYYCSGSIGKGYNERWKKGDLAYLGRSQGLQIYQKIK